jgi:hypothetical protein
VWKSLSEVDFQKLFSGAINLPGVFAIILRTFGAGPGVWGEGPVLDPLLAGKSAIFYKSTATKSFGVAIVLLDSIKCINKVQTMICLSTSLV